MHDLTCKDMKVSELARCPNCKNQRLHKTDSPIKLHPGGKTFFGILECKRCFGFFICQIKKKTGNIFRYITREECKPPAEVIEINTKKKEITNA